MRKLMLAPDADGYSSVDGDEVVRSELEGGAGRYRRAKVGASRQVRAQWTLNRAQYQYWRAFYRAATGQGATAFLCDLVGEDGLGPAEYTCRFVPGSVSLTSQRGFTYVMQAQLDVTPPVADEEFDQSVLESYEAFGDDVAGVYAMLDRLANQTMPDSLHAE